MVGLYISPIFGRGLIDTGASISLISQKFFDKMIRQKAQFTTLAFERKLIVMADNSPMDVRKKIQANMKLGGIIITAEFLIINKLGYDVIVGQDILESTKANIDTHTRTLTLYEGLVIVTMTHSGDIDLVKTVAAVITPSLSEAIVSVSCTRKLNEDEYIIEGLPTATTHPLLVGRTLINAKKHTFPCRVMNISEKEIKLKAKTTLGILSPVIISSVSQRKSPLKQKRNIKK